MFNPLKIIFGTRNERELKRFMPVVEEINGLEPGISKLSDRELRLKTDIFKESIAKRRKEFDRELHELRIGFLEATVPQEKQKIKRKLKIVRNNILSPFMAEAFAVVRESAKRNVNMRPFDVQIIGAIVLHQGRIAEMATGEGKTLVATMPLYLNALTGEGVHLVTVNDYLARRDRDWMAPVYEALGLTVGVIQQDMDSPSRQKAYRADITYGRNDQFGFDYLRDNMVLGKSDLVQRRAHYAIVDEVDSILIDESRTPLIISGPSEESTDKYYKFAKFSGQLKRDLDYEVDEKAQTVTLTEDGVVKVEKLLGIENISDPENIEIQHHINQALRAKELFDLDVDYMIKDNQVVIVDEFTGRLMPGRRWSDGLHQAVEAKEGVKIEKESQTLATITHQNYFRLYEKLAGMTGTADTEAEEFAEIYDLDVVVIPENKPLRRMQYPDMIYKTMQEKYEAVVKEIIELHEKGTPVLVGTISIEKSERLSHMLNKKGMPHHVLNAKYHEMEAEIVARAGQEGAVTIATNMAGRGTDIVLGEGVADKGGLHIIGTERHEARRIDNQLRGRAGRQGDPGSSRFYLSLEDDLMRIFASERISSIMDRIGWEKGVPLEHRWLTGVIEKAQKRVEERNFGIRKQLLEFDNVMNRQREVIYEQRIMVLYGENLKEHIEDMLAEIIGRMVETFAGGELHPEDWDLNGLYKSIGRNLGVKLEEKKIDVLKISSEELKTGILEFLNRYYEEKEKAFGLDMMRQLEQVVMLEIVDSKWKEHLLAMDHLREGIHLRAYGQRDPLVEYQREGSALFQEMISGIKEDIVKYLFKIRIAPEKVGRPHEILHGGEEQFTTFVPFGSGSESGTAGSIPESRVASAASQAEVKSAPFKREGKKIGRNDPCPCGSGKKYKKCCGK